MLILLWCVWLFVSEKKKEKDNVEDIVERLIYSKFGLFIGFYMVARMAH